MSGTSVAPDRLPYGTPGQLAQMLDSIGVSIREEPDDQWRDPELRAATESLRDLLNARLKA